MTQAIRGAYISFKDDPFLKPVEECLVYESDGLIVMEDGLISALGPYNSIKASLPKDMDITHYKDCLICPGFIDNHVHYPQTEMIASYGEQLLDWLNDYAFVTEQKYADKAYASQAAAFFCDQLLANGTTSALVFCTVHPQSVEALFEQANKRNMRLAAGKVLMDRNAPDALCDTPQSGYDQSKALLQKWHGKGRALYAITPRFAITSSPEQLELAGALKREFPDVFLHSHISENKAEIEWVKELFPKHENYLDVYAHHGLAGRRAVYAHGVHLSEQEFAMAHDTGVGLTHCPTSNLFLGSGLFNINKAKDPKRPVHVGLGTDIGGGTSFSLLATMGAAYKVSQLAKARLTAAKAFFLATLGAAQSLDLEDKIGALNPGLEADIAVLDLKATPLLEYRLANAQNIEEQLFVLMTLGDDRAVKATYVAGACAYRR